MDETWVQLYERAAEMIERARHAGAPLWFRGQNTTWTLTSSIHRAVTAESRGGYAPELEARVRARAGLNFAEFKRRAWGLMSGEDRSPWSIVCAMQHYRFETRLIDWTESFAHGLYFALLGSKDDGTQPVVYVLDPIAMNKHAGLDGVLYLDETPLSTDPKSPDSILTRFHPACANAPTGPNHIAVLPLLSNDRMRAQRACFTMAPDSFRPLDAIAAEASPPFLTQIPIPRTARADAVRFLEVADVGRSAVFPDFEGLAGHFADLAAGRRRHLMEMIQNEQFQRLGFAP